MRRSALLVCLAAVACPRPTIPGTNIRDTPEARAVLDVFGRYRQALEARDTAGIVALAAPGYTDPGDPSRGVPPTEYTGLKDKLQSDLSKVTGVRLDATIKELEVKGAEARLDYFQVIRYAVATPSGEKWKSESDDARMKFIQVNGEWKIASGL
jgi:hypothetical protein